MNSKGYSLIEVLMFLVIMAVLSGVVVTYLNESIKDEAFNATLQEMEDIRNALVGDETLKTRDIRTDFGYHGDLGGLPSALSGLLSQPGGVSAWTTDNTRRFMSGWNGPYLKQEDSGTDFTRDAWGNLYVYSPTASPPSITSLGADGTAGGVGLNQDITVELSNDTRLATVHGFLVSGTPAVAADVAATITLHYPNGSGARTSATTSTVVGNNGYFSFSNIPLGNRSLEINVGGTVYGPVMFTVDRASYRIPTALTSVTTAPTCTENLQFALASSSGAESTTTVNLSVVASAACTVDMSVAYAITAGTATAGSDFTAATGTLTIPAGSTSGNVTITIINDSATEGAETVIATISSPSPTGVSLGAQTTHTYTINASDPCAAGSVFAQTNGTFTMPVGCTRLVIKAWGAGGGAGADQTTRSGVGGAGGYAFTNTLTVTAGTQYTYVVGTGGRGGVAGCTGGSTGAHAGGAGGSANVGAAGSGAIALLNNQGAKGNGTCYAGGSGRYGGGGGGGGDKPTERGGAGGGSTQVTLTSSGAVVLIAGGGGGGGGAAGWGGSGGAGGAGCAGAGGNGTGARAGGGGGAGTCFGTNTQVGAGQTPANSAQAGGAGAGGSRTSMTCAITKGADGAVLFEYSE